MKFQILMWVFIGVVLAFLYLVRMNKESITMISALIVGRILIGFVLLSNKVDN